MRLYAGEKFYTREYDAREVRYEIWYGNTAKPGFSYAVLLAEPSMQRAACLGLFITYDEAMNHLQAFENERKPKKRKGSGVREAYEAMRKALNECHTDENANCMTNKMAVVAANAMQRRIKAINEIVSKALASYD